MGKFKKVFRGLPDPRADNAQHELADIAAKPAPPPQGGANEFVALET
jgi:hypothetical protein